MNKRSHSALLLILVLVSVSVVTGQIANSSQVPKAVAASKTTDSTPRENPAAGSERSQSAQKYYESGDTLYAAGKISEAIEAFKQASKLQPEDPQTHYMLGMAYSKSRVYRESFESFKRAVRFWPDWPQANFRLGVIAYVLGKNSESVKAYNHLLKLESPLADSLSRIIKGDNQATLAEGGTASDWSRIESEAVSTETPVKENTSAKRDSIRVPATTNVESKVVPAGLSSSINDTAPVAGASTAPVEDPAVLTNIYRVGVGDILDIRVLNSKTSRSTLYTVIDGGLIDMAITGGPIAVGGLTTDVIQALIAAELKRRAIEEGARVSVGVRQYASHSVIITGLVSNPGAKFLRREAIPLYVLLAEAQARLDAGRVMIMRSGNSGLTLDLSDPADLNFLIRSGDMISVTSRPQEFYYIAGRINYPGQKLFQPGVTLVQAILAAGGVTREGGKIEISREGQDRRLTTTTFKLKEIKSGKIQDPPLQPGDRIEVIR